MCFSATASFATAAGLSIISLLSIKKSPTKKLIPLAASPLFFALQQSCEGLVWITLNNGDTTSILHNFGVYGFLFFASCWWPIYIPFSLYIPEKIRARKNLLLITMFIGLCSALFLFFNWILQTSGAEIINHHINYPVPNYPFNIANEYLGKTVSWIMGLFYCTATAMSFFISSIPYAWLIGTVVGLGLIIAYLFYFVAFTSVWCFFAAVSSIFIYFIIKNYHSR